MISRKIVIAAGAATVAGALSATLAFAAENGASLALSDSGTSSSLSASGSAFGGSAGGSLGSNGGSFTVSLPDAPSVPTPDVDSLMDHMRSGAQELASDIQAAATGVWNQGESAGDKAQAQGQDAVADAVAKAKDAIADGQAKATDAVSDAKARVQDGLADGEAALDKTQSQLKEAVTDGQQRVAGAVTTVANAVGQPSLGISSWSASGSTSGEQVTSPTVTLSNGTDSLSLGGSMSVSNPTLP